MEEMGAPAQQLVVDEVAEEGTIGAAGFAHGTSREKIISLILQQVNLKSILKTARVIEKFSMYFATVSS